VALVLCAGFGTLFMYYVVFGSRHERARAELQNDLAAKVSDT
jgi:hypothetical protein